MQLRRQWYLQDEAKPDGAAGGGAAGGDASAAGAGAAGGDGAGAGGDAGAAGGDKGAAGVGAGDGKPAAGADGKPAGDGKPAADGKPAGDAGKPAAGDGGKGAAAGDGKPADGKPAGVDDDAGKGKWQADWRELTAGGDEKVLARLNRYATPDVALKALLQLQDKIGAGELRTVLKKNSTPEEIAQWKKEQGVPETPADYKLELKDGLVIGKEDKPVVDSFLASLHKANVPEAGAAAAVQWYYDEVARVTAERAEQDRAYAAESQEVLRAEWGADYKPNMNMVAGLIETLPVEVRELFKGGRLADGKPILSNPAVLKTINQWSREINPVTTVVPNAGANVASAIDDEIAGIEKTMREDRPKYNADEKMQKRYMELLGARERGQGKPK